MTYAFSGGSSPSGARDAARAAASAGKTTRPRRAPWPWPPNSSRTAGTSTRTPPKTNIGIRLIALDEQTNQDFIAQKTCQQQEREASGEGWVDTGRIFTQEDGSLLHPGKVSDLFARLVEAGGLPPIRLHDLRHVAATLMLAAGVDIKVVSETLGHSDTRITRDIYQSVLDDLARDSAVKVVQLVPHTRRPLVAVNDGEPAASPRRPRMTPPSKSDEAKEERSA